MLYYVRQASIGDLEDILKVIDNGRKNLEKNDIPQWRDGDGPSPKVISEDLELGEGFVLIENATIMGYGTITKNEQPSYDSIQGGSWIPSTTYVSLHRVVVHTDVKERGMGLFLIRSLISVAISSSFNDIRIDTHPKNHRMQRVIEKSGFTYKGSIQLNVNNGERYAYQISI